MYKFYIHKDAGYQEGNVTDCYSCLLLGKVGRLESLEVCLEKYFKDFYIAWLFQ